MDQKELPIYNKEGQDTGRRIILPNDIFGIEPNDHVIYMDIRHIMANQRQGTHKTKGRSEVNGSTKKLGRQKGGGGARHGSKRSPVMVGGGRLFGPQPRDYSFKLNKKEKKLACKSSLSYKAISDNIIMLEDFDFDVAKTKQYAEFLKNTKVDNLKTILLSGNPGKNLMLSSRNIMNSVIKLPTYISTYDIMNANKILITESGLKVLIERFTKE